MLIKSCKLIFIKDPVLSDPYLNKNIPGEWECPGDKAGLTSEYSIGPAIKFPIPFVKRGD